MMKFGTTERDDAGLNLQWCDRMSEVSGAILITKSINDRFIDAILHFKNKSILHATITGFGSSPFEPNVMDYQKSIQQLEKLITMGFPAEQVVLRVDPIIPLNIQTKSAIDVLDGCKELGIKRVRISFINMYPHVINRLRNAKLLQYMKYTTFTIPDFYKYEILDYLAETYPFYNFELCADLSEKTYPNINQIGCVSPKDLAILSLGDKTNQLEYGEPNRKGCLCPKNKIELLEAMKPCAHGCLYCYWKD